MQSRRRGEAVTPKDLPFEALELYRDGGSWIRSISAHGFGKINERVRIPAIGRDAKEHFVGGGGIDNRAGLGSEGLQGGVIRAAGVPVFAVGEIAFAAMHDGVPEGVGACALFVWGVLDDAMAFVEAVMPEPKGGEKRGGEGRGFDRG